MGASTLIPPTPDTNVPGTTMYAMTLSPIDATKGCYNSSLSHITYLIVAVNPRPTRPVVSASTIALCQFAQANSLTATATDGASLLWYGTNASDGTGSTAASQPATAVAGLFKYYVAQKLNDCESERAEITVDVKSASPAPVVSAVSYCQGASTGQLSAVAASGGSLLWYTTPLGGVGSSGGPTPSAGNAGTQTYYVTQAVGSSCESQRVALTVNVYGLPPAPILPATTYVFCQNAPGEALSAKGQNLKWYDIATGGTGVGILTPSTSSAGTKSYYVSQTVNGCEGPRALLPVQVKPLPAAPGVLPKDICQFAKAEPLTAQGNNLRWYYPDDKPVGATPTPPTDRGATHLYKVSQADDGCEGPKAILTVNILTTPLPTVVKTLVEVCQGTSPPPLQATGTNLKWTDPAGNVTATAPAPPTLTATTKPEGNVFYVTQTGNNGCESPGVAISVFVQTAPTLSILGTTTTNLGLEIPLKLTFTGVGPYRYKLSDGSGGIAVNDTVLMVLPTRSTTYQVVEVANKCGVGLPGNNPTVTVTVNVPAIQTLAFATTTLCSGASLSTNFITSGVFNEGSVFRLQYTRTETDSAKINFVDIAGSRVANGNISGILPANIPAGTYWVRVAASNPKIPIFGNISPSVLTIRSRATAALAGTQTIVEGQPANLSVAFTGDGPWGFSYQDSTAALGSGIIKTIETSVNPHVLAVRPLKTTTYFLTAVRNGCGAGTRAGSSVVVNVAPLLGIEDQALAETTVVFPVPASASLTVRIEGLRAGQPAVLELKALNGRSLLRHETLQFESVLPINQYPAGVYLLHITVGDRIACKRVIKW